MKGGCGWFQVQVVVCVCIKKLKQKNVTLDYNASRQNNFLIAIRIK